ncbi:NADPH-dependent FMN reductase [Sphaerotilus hippei]|nr:NADPH-dependent FMN reductase [Sphaerotilus hippei]
MCGSLRAGSINRMALNLAGELMPDSMQLDVVDWRDIPMFDADLLAQGVPASVQGLAERIRSADGVIIATPEYNFTLPGAFKNVLDWLSRGDDQPFAGKPVAILSATPGPLGGARVQYDLRRVMLFLNAMVLVKPEIFIGGAGAKFDASGRCSDDTTRQFVTAQMTAFEKWIRATAAMNAAR